MVAKGGRLQWKVPQNWRFKKITSTEMMVIHPLFVMFAGESFTLSKGNPDISWNPESYKDRILVTVNGKSRYNWVVFSSPI